MWTAISAAIAQASGEPFTMRGRQPVGGGCINSAYTIEGDEARYFVKTNAAIHADMFAAEFEGLHTLAASDTVRVPLPLCWGVSDTHGYLVLECIEFGRAETRSMARLGEGLAALHRHTHAQYGWHRDNTIGTTPQLNHPHSDWVTFWRQRRLGYQLELAAHGDHRGALQRKGERLVAQLDQLFGDHRPAAALLHGDLWAGNHGYTDTGEPVLFDPAVYYGDRETDLAMTELFGGYSPDFYHAYQAAYPLDEGYHVRKQLYNLYHVLNHLNLFGGGYGAQAERMIDSLLSEVS